MMALHDLTLEFSRSVQTEFTKPKCPTCRYKSRACECSVYSCLTQFTAPELLTGNNKWACERCSKMAAEKRTANNGKGSNSSDDDAESEDCGGDADDKKRKKSGKVTTVYSNASKQG